MGMQGKTRTRKIHKGIAAQLVSDKTLLRAFSIAVDLAGLTKSRSIHNYKERIKALSNTLRINHKTLHKYLKIILKKGWAVEENNNLCFISRRKVAKKFGVCQKGYWAIETGGFKDLELHIRAIAIEENKHKQHEAINQKIISREVKKAKIHCKVIKKRFAKTVNVKRHRDQLRAVNIIMPINSEVTLSRKGIAKLYGLKNAKSGSYWASKIKKKVRGFTDERKEPKCLGKMDIKYFRELQLNSKRYLFLNNGECFARLPNHVGYRLSALQSICTNFPHG